MLFDALEESLFPFVITNFSESTVSISLCWNWGIFHTVVAGIKSDHFYGWACTSQDCLKITRRGAGTVFRRGSTYCFINTNCICEKCYVYFSSFFWGTYLFQNIFKHVIEQDSTPGLQENKTKLIFTHSCVIAKINFLIQKYTNRSNGYCYRQFRK